MMMPIACYTPLIGITPTLCSRAYMYMQSCNIYYSVHNLFLLIGVSPAVGTGRRMIMEENSTRISSTCISWQSAYTFFLQACWTELFKQTVCFRRWVSLFVGYCTKRVRCIQSSLTLLHYKWQSVLPIIMVDTCVCIGPHCAVKTGRKT